MYDYLPSLLDGNMRIQMGFATIPCPSLSIISAFCGENILTFVEQRAD